MNIEIGDIVYYNSPTRLEPYGIVVRKAKWIDTFEDGEVFYYVRSLCDKAHDELVYEDRIISLYKKENNNEKKTYK